MQQNIFNSSGAHFSACRKYRYYLWRIWDETKPMVAFIGLNPSTANESENDPTIRRVVSFANSWGFGGVYMLNLFAYCSPYPKELNVCDDPVFDNDYYLKFIASTVDEIIFAWGNYKEAKERSIHVSKMFPDAKCLIKNNDGTPRHPLYVPGNTKPISFF
jgi:hypothetical protein